MNVQALLDASHEARAYAATCERLDVRERLPGYAARHLDGLADLVRATPVRPRPIGFVPFRERDLIKRVSRDFTPWTAPSAVA